MKPRILIVSDSPARNTGLARVARELALYLVETGQYDVHCYGWGHRPDAPETLYPVHTPFACSYPGLVAHLKPDLVLAIGDVMRIAKLAEHPHDHVLAAYATIPGYPISRKWAEALARFDHLMVPGRFGEEAIRQAAPDLTVHRAAFGVDLRTFHPMSAKARMLARRQRVYDDRRFVLGTVCRNRADKHLPALLKAFAQFIRPWTVHEGEPVHHAPGTDVSTSSQAKGRFKEDAFLYLHTDPRSVGGHDLPDLVERYGLQECVDWSIDMEPVLDHELNEIYNSFDVFTLPTGGEGLGLSVLEAMAAGVPTLTTNYSSHCDYTYRAGETIEVANFVTSPLGNVEQAVVDVNDYVLKLDRLYYEQQTFLAKWGQHLVARGFPAEQLNDLACGQSLRASLGEAGRVRAGDFRWRNVLPTWRSLIDTWLPAAAA